MRRKMWILLCSLWMGLLLTGGFVYIYNTQTEKTVCEVQEMEEQYAWWSMMYERPNPERLPVQVHFQWLKGLE